MVGWSQCGQLTVKRGQELCLKSAVLSYLIVISYCFKSTMYGVESEGQKQAICDRLLMLAFVAGFRIFPFLLIKHGHSQIAVLDNTQYMSAGHMRKYTMIDL